MFLYSFDRHLINVGENVGILEHYIDGSELDESGICSRKDTLSISVT